MKQNEKFLVYAVTGFLVVILGVAVLFGKETPRQLPGESPMLTAAVTPPSLEDVLNRRAQQPLPGDGDRGAVAAAAGAEAAPVSPAASENAAAVPEPAKTLPLPLDQPLAANVQLLPPTPAALVTEKLGLSRRENGFRLVRARGGDSLGALVQKWCGSTADFLDQARGLNEELTTLRVGQEIVLPWVDDEVLLAAFERSVAPRSSVASTPAAAGPPVPAVGSGPMGSGDGAQPAAAAMGSALLQRPEPVVRDAGAHLPAAAPVAPAVASAARRHKVKTGESLWKIAEREVGAKQAAKFITQVRELNPGVDVDRIRVGQELVLPKKP